MAEERVDIILDVDLQQDAAFQQLAETTQEMERLKETQRELRQARKDGEISEEDYAAALAQTTLRQKELGSEKRKLTKEIQSEKGSLQDLRNQLSANIAERNKVNLSTEEGRKQFDLLNQEILEQTNEIKDLEQAGGDYRRNVGNYTESVKEAFTAQGGLNQMFAAGGVNLQNLGGQVTAVIPGLGGMVKALQALRVAILTSGIGALAVAIGAVVVALASLQTALNNTQRGQDLQRQATSALSASFAVLTDRVSSFGLGIIDAFRDPLPVLKSFAEFVGNFVTARLQAVRDIGQGVQNLFSGDFSEAFDKARDAVSRFFTGFDVDTLTGFKDAASDLVTEIESEAAAAARLAQTFSDLEKAQVAATIQQSQFQRDLAKALEDSKDFNTSIENRQAALERARRIQEEASAQEIRLQQIRVKALKEELDLANSTTEDYQALADEIAKLNNLQKERSDRLRDITNREKELAAQIQSRVQRETAAERELAKAQIARQIDATKDQVRQTDLRIRLIELELAARIQAIRSEVIEEEEANKRIQLAREVANEQIARERMQVQDLVELRQRAAQFEGEFLGMREQQLRSLQELTFNVEGTINRAAQNINDFSEQVAATAQVQAALFEFAFGTAIDQITLEAARAREDAENSAIVAGALFSQISDLAGDNAVFQKGLAIAQATINAIQGVTAALALGPVGIPLAGLIGALGAAQVAKIIATPIDGSGSVPSVTGANNASLTGSGLNGRRDRAANAETQANIIAARPVFVSVIDIQDANNRAQVRDTTTTL